MNNEPATTRQKELIRKLSNGSLKQIDLNFLESGCTKEAADKWIKELIADTNGDSHKDFKQNNYSMGYLSLVKSGCELYKGTGKSLKAVIDEVNNIY